MGFNSESIIMDISNIKNIIDSIFNGGYGESNVKFLIPDKELLIKISNHENTTTISFLNSLPCIKIKKFISLSFSIEGIVLNKDDGYIKIKNFPDISISYLTNLGDMYGAKIPSITDDIEQEFSDEQSKKIAHKCLQYAESWAIITGSSGINFAESNINERKKLKKMCHDFVVENVRKDVKREYGSAFISWFIILVLIPSIARFIVTRLLNRIF